jgi:arylsulfatase A-like enzyme
MGPGISKGKVCTKPVQLLDLYPTLLELSQLDPDPKLEGHSLVPLLKDVKANWPYYAQTCFGPGNYAINSEHYRYIHYNDGTEEFYDRKIDSEEWYNVVNEPKYAKVIEEHRSQLPKTEHKILGEDSTGHISYKATEAKAKEN